MKVSIENFILLKLCYYTVLEGLINPPTLPDNSTSLLSNASSTFLYINKSSVAVTVERIGSGKAERGFRFTELSLLSVDKGAICNDGISPGSDILNENLWSDSCLSRSFSSLPLAEFGEMNEF